MSTFTSEPGALLADRYRLEDRVNTAGGWAAWKATDETLARAVTVLTLAPDFPRIPEVVMAARAASRLTDSRLAQVFDVEDGGDRAYVVLEWVAGDSLDDLLVDGPLDPAQGVALVTEASKALAGAHAAGLSHLCLTPESLHWTPGGGVKVTGLGIDAALDGVSADDPALADTRGLGRLLYATLTGHWAGLESTSLPPAPMAEGQPRTPRQVRAGVPTAIDAVACEAMFQRHRRDRPPVTTPALLAQALTEVSPALGRPGVPPAGDDFGAGRRLPGDEQDDPFSWSSGNGAGRPGQRGRGHAAPGQRVVTTSAVFGIIVVLVLVGIGVGGWMLSHHQASPPPKPTPSQQPTHAPAVVTLKPVSATASDNPDKAGLTIDGDPGTFWYSQYYLNYPDFGRLKAGIGLVLDMGEQVKVSQVQVRLGPTPGANVQIMVNNSPQPPSSAVPPSGPVAAKATDISGWYTFTLKHPATGRDVVIWFSKLPPKPGTGNHYQADVYNVTIRGKD
jgi:serine/threonine protein kinase